MAGPKVQNFIQFAKERGLTTDADVLSHIHAGLRSMPTTMTYKRWNERTLSKLSAERDEAREAYRRALDAGEVEAPKPLSTEEIATGLPELPSTQAALRILAKRANAAKEHSHD